MPSDIAYLHHRPHLRQSSIPAVSHCIVRKQPANLIKDNILIPFISSGHGLSKRDASLQGHREARITASVIQGPSSDTVNQMISQHQFSEHRVLDYTSISGPSFLSTHSVVNLLGNEDIRNKAQSFIRTFHPIAANFSKGMKMLASDKDIGQPIWKSHHAASSLTTPVDQHRGIGVNATYD